MKTPSPTKKADRASPGCVSPDKIRKMNRSPVKSDRSMDRKKSLTVLGHSMISRGGDAESDLSTLNLDLRLITGRMAQTMNTYETSDSSYTRDKIKEVEKQLDAIDDPHLKLQIKGVLEDYKRLAYEREGILATLESWFSNCADEFMEELIEFESQFEGDETLLDNINQAKDIIAKIKFINGKIVEFQSNGMSTKKLIAQKKTLEDELMKKKVIVDNTQTGTEAYSIFKNNIENLASLIKGSSANDVDRAIMDLKLSEAAQHVGDTLVTLERSARRVGVLFKNVKELEVSNNQLADENSFLKQRLSKVDKHFSEAMTKKVKKLDNALVEMENVRHLTTTGMGQNPDDVTRRMQKSHGLSMEMEMIENYQEQIHTLDNENKELIAKLDATEEYLEESKEEILTLEFKLQNALSQKEMRENSLIASEHPLVKLDTTSDNQQNLKSTSSGTSISYDSPMRSISPTILRKKNHKQLDNRALSVVSTITIQDGKELDALKMDNQLLRQQVNKLKTSLCWARKTSTARNKKLNKETQTKMLWNPTEPSDTKIRTTTPALDEQGDEILIGSSPEVPIKLSTKRRKKGKLVKKRQTVVKSAARNTASGSESHQSSSQESDLEHDLEKEELAEETNEAEDGKLNKSMSTLRAYVRKQEQESLQKKKRKAKEMREAAAKEASAAQKEGTQGKDEDEEEENESTVSESSEEANDFKNVSQTPSQLALIRKNNKPIIKKNKDKKMYEKSRVKFDDESKEDDYTPIPSFEKSQIPTPKVENETQNTIEVLGRIKDEMQDFLSYGHKFISSIISCLTEAADDDLALKMDHYSDLEQKIMGLETSLNILMYGIDLGMFLATPAQSRPSYSPIPFENKLYFQENLSKHLRESYPSLNVNAMKVFDPDLDPFKPAIPHSSPLQSRKSPPYQPYSEFNSHERQPGIFSDFMAPLNTTPEPKPRRQPPPVLPRKNKKNKFNKKEEAAGKLEEIMAALTTGIMMPKQGSQKKSLDERSFADIVDHVMPKEIAIKYLKLVQPTRDTLGKSQYNEKLKRGVLKVKDLLDLVNINSNQGVIKGMPPNKLGEPRTRQTKVHETTLVVSDLIGHTTPLVNSLAGFPPLMESYKNKIVHHDERVRASLDDYDEDMGSSNSLTVIEVPLTSRSLLREKRFPTRSSVTKIDDKSGARTGEMFDLTKSNPNMDHVPLQEKRSFLPVVTQNLLPHSEAKNFRPRAMKKVKKAVQPSPMLDQIPPKIADILSLDLGPTKPKFSSSVSKLPNISSETNQVNGYQSFP